MKLLKIAILIVLMSLIVSCDKKGGGFYPEPDNNGTVDDDSTTVPDKDTAKPDPDNAIGDEDSGITDSETDEDIDDDPIDPDNDGSDDDILPLDSDVPDNDSDKIPYGCGNGIKEFGEECDNGDFNSDAPGEHGLTCRTNCKYAKCGDKIKDLSEFCDDGNDLNGDYCSADCTSVNGSCGDGIVQTNEACDKAPYGNGIGSYCSADCQEISGSCGDGIVQDNEICDKADFGDGTGPYYCSANCKKIIGACGDQVIQPNETCDDGENNGRYGYCNSLCSGIGMHCGDGVKNWEGDEACDDGNNDDGDYCSADCMTFYGWCGDGIKLDFEACDKATYGAGTGLYCSDDCKTVLGRCGDEIKQDHEQCDWGTRNIIQYCEYGEEPPCQRCNTVCNLVEGVPTFCGDGRIDFKNGEICDKAESTVGEGKGTGAYCSFDCTEVLGSCGDGVKQSHEACDKATYGDGIGPEYCAADCTAIIGWCGDGNVQTGEMCDLGGGNTDYCAYEQSSCIVCNTFCQQAEGITSFCGDSKTDALNGELCDSGSNNGSYRINAPGYCNSDCKGLGAGGYCGDSIEQTIEGEECDAGLDNGDLYCEYGLTSCFVCSVSCRNVAGIVAYCGDGKLSNGEKCDDGEFNGDYGKCKSDCTGIGNYCGDGNTTDSEVCDDGTNNGKYGYCNGGCTAVIECGDGIKQPEEVCDAGNDNGDYRLAYPGNCDSDCQGIGEAGYCGNASIESPFEDCDHGGVIKTACEYGEISCTLCNEQCVEVSGATSYCGDKFIDISNDETCDDGSNNGKYGFCKSDCSGKGPFCGDGVKTDDEECDDGENNGNYGYCNSTCSAMGPFCGDNEPNGPEICDNGNNNGKYGFCNSGCNGFSEKCGDEILQREDCTGFANCVVVEGANEVCDDGSANGTYGHCDSSCSGIGPFCGDGIKTDDEECDDGEDNGKYGFCNTVCSGINTTCGNGTINPENDEVCDSGENNGKYGYCKLDCSGMGERCGDGIEQIEHSEACDDGENNGKQGYCNTACTGPFEWCGDNIKNGTEQCDNGTYNGQTHCEYGLTSCKVCSTSCVESNGLTMYCGNSKKEDMFGEVCDQGSLNGKYQAAFPGTCNSDCKGVGAAGYCGDGGIQSTEQCDNGIDNGNAYCDYGLLSCTVCKTDCKTAPGTPRYCGDGTKQDNEVCDEGTGNNGQYSADFPGSCNTDCQGKGAGGYCGDGLQQGTEQCDNGTDNGVTECGYGLTSCKVCTTSCTEIDGTATYCGDGDLNGDETCDDGTLNGQYMFLSPGYCNTACDGRGEGGFCGDEIKNGNEECDEGPMLNGNYGHCKTDCSGLGVRCGDGVIQSEFSETCDDGIYNGLYDPSGAGTACNSSCNGFTAVGYCGDGETQTDFEDCDDSFNNGLPGFCSAECVYPCGNGSVDVGEFCDTANVNCADFSQFSSGTVVCPVDCSVPDLSTCVENMSYSSPFFTTSQTECYDNTGVITCPDEGDPFYGQEPQFDYAVQDFTVEADVITENISGLMWQKDTPSTYSGCTGGDPAGSKCSLIEADEYCGNLDLGGYDDWRIPTSFEVTNIMIYEQSSNLIYNGFLNTVFEDYLSWYHFVSFLDGTNTEAEKPSIGLVKCVRGEEQYSEREIFQSGDLFADVLDRDSGKLVFWQYDSAQTEIDWEDALEYCSTLVVGDGGASGGMSGFRLPTVVELQSFAFESLYTVPPLVGSGSFWTSTTVYSTPTNAYTVDFETGNVNMTGKTGTSFVICVK